MEFSEGTVITIIMSVIVLAVAAVALTINAVFNALNARGDSIKSDMNGIAAKLTSHLDAHEKIVGEQLSSIKAAVAAGTEEHKVWQNAMKETNERIADQFDKSNERIDKLMMHLLNQKS